MDRSLTSGVTTRRRFLLSAGCWAPRASSPRVPSRAPAAPTAAPAAAAKPTTARGSRGRTDCRAQTDRCASRARRRTAPASRRRQADRRAGSRRDRRDQGRPAQRVNCCCRRAARRASTWTTTCGTPTRSAPTTRPAEHHPRAAGLLQRLRRQGVHVAGRELRVQPRLQAADDQDCAPASTGVTASPSAPTTSPTRLSSLKELGSKVRWGVDVQQVVESATATDANTVVVKFKVPGAALLRPADLQVRHRRLHRPEAHLRAAGTGRTSSSTTWPRAGR